ncbi:MAG: mechanosensitive ion channel [Moraxellaceae bacterium]|nr:mechanosensitive ion channel [Moraxellaceae bacterium]
MDDYFSFMWDLLSYPLGSIGSTSVTPLRLTGLLFIITLTWWLSTLLENKLVQFTHHHQTQTGNAHVYGFIRLGRYIVWMISMMIGLNYLGFDLGSLAFIGGAFGIGIGLGLQNIFSNFASGIIILLERTLKQGDFIDLQSGVMGRVSEIGMRYTRVTTTDNVDVIVPNSEFTTGRVINWTMNNDTRRIHVPFGVAYGVDKNKVKEAGLAAAAQLTGIINIKGKEPDVWLVRFGDSSLDFELVVWLDRNLSVTPQITQAKLLWLIESELRERGLEIPFPQRDLHIRSGVLSVKHVDN